MLKDGKLDFDRYLEEIVEALDLRKESKESITQLVVLILPKVFHRILNAISRSLESYEMVEKLSDIAHKFPKREDIEILLAFVEENATLREKVVEELEDLKQELLEYMNSIDEILAIDSSLTS